MQVQVLPLVPNTRRGDVIVTFVAHNHSRLITLVEVQFLPPQQISRLITLRLSGSKLTIGYGVMEHTGPGK